MAINLSNVNISLQQFQDISSGKYNAGEIKLTGERSIGKINNHVTLTRLNNTSLGLDEVISIKDAFVRTLAENGVKEQNLNRIRAELGLDRTGGCDMKLKDRAFKPLSRQQVRNILDHCASEINKAQGEGTIASSKTIYADVSSDAMFNRKELRDSVNADLNGSRSVTGNREFDLFHSVVTGTVAYCPPADVADVLRIAKAQRDEILQACGNSPRDTPCRVTCNLGNGAQVGMSPAMTEKEYVKRLNDMIAFLESDNGQLYSETADVLREFGECETSKARQDWFAAQMRSPDGSRKMRIVAVKELYDRGIDDYKTLDLMNKLQPSILYAFLINLVGILARADADEIRNSFEFRALPAMILRRVPEEDKVRLPVLPPADEAKAV